MAGKRFKVTFELLFDGAWHPIEREGNEDSVRGQYNGLVGRLQGDCTVRNPRLFECEEPVWKELSA